MFNNVGKQFMRIAKFIAYLTVAISVFLGITVVVIMVADVGIGIIIPAFLLAAIIVAIGVLFGWLSSVALYAFGQLVDDVHIISENTYVMGKSALNIEEKILEKIDI